MLQVKPEKLLIVDIDRDTEEDRGDIGQIEAQYNPTSFDRSIEAIYEEHAVLGQSHAPHEWLRTSNQLINLSLVYHSHTRSELDDAEKAVRFIESFLYPPETDNFLQNAPSRMLVVWPQTMSLRCRLHKMKVSHTQFNKNGSTVSMRIDMSLKEASVRRITKGLVQTLGIIRASKGTTPGGS